MKHLPAVVIAAALAASQPACYGSYSAFHAVHRWNGSVTGSKVANSAVHLGLWIIPVYPLLLTADFLIFNTIEFATDKRVFN
jgi:hypothetical protein